MKKLLCLTVKLTVVAYQTCIWVVEGALNHGESGFYHTGWVYTGQP